MPNRWALGTSVSLVVVVALCGCGGSDGSPPWKSKSAFRTRTSAVTYVPATPTCSAISGAATIVPSPVPSTPTHVSGYRVCGPFTATTGSSTLSCPLPQGSVGPFRLLAYNGNSDGTARVSSATFTMNGAVVLDTQVFDQQTNAATARTSLSATNTLQVTVNSPGTLRVEVVDEGETCAILAPTNVTSTGFSSALSVHNSFPVPELQLFNGGLDGLSPTDHAQVSFNGTVLISGTDLRQKTTADLAPLALALPNALSASAGATFSSCCRSSTETRPRRSSPSRRRRMGPSPTGLRSQYQGRSTTHRPL